MTNQERSANNFFAIAFLATVFLIVCLGPVFTIWSLNQLFKLQIDFSFENWAATAWLILSIHGIKVYLANSYQRLAR